LNVKIETRGSAKGVKKGFRSFLWPLSKDETEEAMRAVERQNTLILIALGNDHLLLSIEIKRNNAAIRESLGHMQQNIEDVMTTFSLVNSKHRGPYLCLPLLLQLEILQFLKNYNTN
jgi:hypothetical protein